MSEHEPTDLHFLTSEVRIVRVMTEFGEDQHRVHTSDGMTTIEALGMLRLAEHSILNDPEGDE